jgi:hypothetical protein
MTKPSELLVKVAPRIPLFYGIGMGVIEDLIKCGALLHIKKDEILFDEGGEPDSFFILLNGEASVEKSLKKEFYHIATLGSGDCIGETNIINPSKRSARVVALTDCLVFKVYVFKLNMFPGLVKDLYLNIARILEKRLRANNIELATLTAKTRQLEAQVVSVAEDGVEGESGMLEEAPDDTLSAHDSHNELFMRTEGDLKPASTETDQTT